MGELAIRRSRGTAPARYQAVEKAEKQAGAGQSTVRTAGFTVSETLQHLMSRLSQAENHTRESHRTLQTGEVVLAEVQDSLERMAELAQAAAGDEAPDRAALQAELERLRDGIDRMLRAASSGGTPLFLDGDEGVDAGSDALLYAIAGESPPDGGGTLPDWLTKGLAQTALTPERLLAALGLDKTASGQELLAAITGRLPGDSPALSRLAVLYLGAVIACGGSAGAIDPDQAMEGLRQLLETMAQGVSPDEALETLTNGAFTSFQDFQEQFGSGTAPGLEDFLTGLLLSEGDSVPLPGVSLSVLLGEIEDLNLDLMTGLLTALQSSEVPPAEPEAGADAGEGTAAPQAAVMQLEHGQATGRDLSGVRFDPASGAWEIGGTEDVSILGTSQGGQALLLTGSGTVTLRDMTVTTLTIRGDVRIFSAGELLMEEVRLEQGASLTLDGGGTVRLGRVYAGEATSLRLAGGTIVLEPRADGTPEELALPVILDGPAFLPARAVSVQTPEGKPLTPLDIIWKTLLPGWSAVTAMSVDGKHARPAFPGGVLAGSARLWLEKGNPSLHGYPIHTAVIRGRDRFGRPRTRYIYLRWDQPAESFQEISMYPNPFTVTGGEPEQDWVYEEESHTLHILTDQVTAVAGGAGTDANQLPFSGRIVLADGIGAVELSLDGVSCRVSQGQAFRLGRENQVTLLLQSGSSNIFESGPGCAGISLGDGASLCIDRGHPAENGRIPAGTLTASGNGGGAGIGRDSGAGRDRRSRILIRGGLITASGAGGGAGIGAGKHGFMGSITISGGTIRSTGGTGGGAGIGGALGAPAGDIRIQGGAISAVAVYHAAAIGAGIQGACGDILITGTARIVQAQGGNPGADIGACLFGGCGEVRVSGAADIGSAGLRTQTGVPLQMGEDTVTLPRFRLSSKVLRLDTLRVSDQSCAQAAKDIVEADRRWVAQIQAAYGALYTRLEQSFNGLFRAQRYFGNPVRDPSAAGVLLEDTRQSILPDAQALRTHGRRGTEDLRQLLR